jgi:Tol biopolymer transport system component
LYESQDSKAPDYQQVLAAPYPVRGQAPVPLNPSGFARLGVPRCSHLGQTVLVSGQQTNGTNWGLYSFDLNNPNLVTTVYNQDLIVGNASWSGDDRYVAFMRRPSGQNVFSLALWTWNASRNLTALDRPEDIVDAKYPAISPRTGEIAFACSNGQAWNLCLTNADGSNVRTVSLKIGLNTNRARPLSPISPVTPSWSPDGAWIALASNQDGDWDVWLYAPSSDVWLNLTHNLGGDQFQPSWSKQ